MAVHPLTYEYLSSRYTLTSAIPVCCRRAWYKARVHPLARDSSEPYHRWLQKGFPKRPGVVENHKRDRHRYCACLFGPKSAQAMLEDGGTRCRT
jgi:hypothetical protein